MEPISQYLILVTNSESDISWYCNDFALYKFYENVEINSNNGKLAFNALSTNVQRPTTPNFPAKIIVESKTHIEFWGVMMGKKQNYYESIQFDYVWD